MRLNCGSLARDAARSGALRAREGRVHRRRSRASSATSKRPHGGTLFLDEIGELPLSMQAKLLRVLENRRVHARRRARRRSRSTCASSPRPTATSPTEAKAGRFREDLYFRSRRFVIDVPPLRERPERDRAARRAVRAAACAAARTRAARARSRPRRWRCAATAGRATCASCATRSSARSCSPRAAVIGSKHLPDAVRARRRRRRRRAPCASSSPSSSAAHRGGAGGGGRQPDARGQAARHVAARAAVQAREVRPQALTQLTGGV